METENVVQFPESLDSVMFDGLIAVPVYSCASVVLCWLPMVVENLHTVEKIKYKTEYCHCWS